MLHPGQPALLPALLRMVAAVLAWPARRHELTLRALLVLLAWPPQRPAPRVLLVQIWLQVRLAVAWQRHCWRRCWGHCQQGRCLLQCWAR